MTTSPVATIEGCEAKDLSPRSCTCHPSDNPPRPCPRKHALRDCREAALASAMWQLLDDFGPNGSRASSAAIAQARIAFEPFNDHEAEPPMSLEEARKIMAELEAR